MYVTASGSLMNNNGDKDVKVRTKERRKCVMKMHVTDVQKPLMSISRTCDAGHRVIFLRDGGYIEHENTGQRTGVRALRQCVSSEVAVRKGFQQVGATMNSESVKDGDVSLGSPCEKDEVMCSAKVAAEQEAVDDGQNAEIECKKRGCRRRRCATPWFARSRNTLASRGRRTQHHGHAIQIVVSSMCARKRRDKHHQRRDQSEKGLPEVMVEFDYRVYRLSWTSLGFGTLQRCIKQS